MTNFSPEANASLAKFENDSGIKMTESERATYCCAFDLGTLSTSSRLERCCECDILKSKSDLNHLDTPDGDKFICRPCERKLAGDEDKAEKVKKARDFLVALQEFGMYCDKTQNDEIFISGDEAEFWDFVVAYVSEKENL